MSNYRKHTDALRRDLAWTHAESGPLDLRPLTITHRAGYLDASIDFEAQSFHPAPKFGEAVPSWSPGYIQQETGDVHTIVADLIALTSDGVSADQAHRWLLAHDLAGLAWPAITDTPTRPTCCVVLLLDSTVSQHTYKQIWMKLASEMLGEQFDPAQADPRHRFDYPRTRTNDSQLLRHDGRALPIGYEFAFGVMSRDFIAPKLATYASDIEAK